MPCKWQERETELPESWHCYHCARWRRYGPFRPGCSPDKDCYEEAKAKEEERSDG